jgi:hypothetical protein
MSSENLAFANLTEELARSLELPDDRPGGTDARAEFSARFAALLQRLERRRGGLDGGEAETLMSALGAAQVQEWELALALLASSQRPQPHARRMPLSIGTLRRRFHFVMSMGADRKRAR